METQADEAVETVESEQMIPQSKVDEIVKQRLARAEKQFAKKYEGIDADEARELLAQKEAAELERQRAEGRFEEILEKTKQTLTSERDQYKSQLESLQVDGALSSAANKYNAVNNNQVAKLLKPNIKLSGDGVEVLDDSGNVRYTDSGNLMSVDDLVSEFLTANPHFVRATSGGSGSQGAAGGSTHKPYKDAADMIANWSNGGREAFAANRGKR